jgi:phosphoribosylamine-glycine ligase
MRSQIFISPEALDRGYDPSEKKIEPRIKSKKSKQDFQAETLIMLSTQQNAPMDHAVKSFTTHKNDSLSGLTDYIMPMSHFARVRHEGETSKFVEGGKNLWILKPVGLNRGQGIHVVDSIKKCKKLIKQYCIGKEFQGMHDKEKDKA